LPGANE
jgi:clathrin heavy chain